MEQPLLHVHDDAPEFDHVFSGQAAHDDDPALL